MDCFVSLLLHTIAYFGQLTMEAAMSHSFKDWFCWKVPADQILGSSVVSSFSTIFLTRIATFHLHVILTSVSLLVRELLHLAWSNESYCPFTLFNATFILSTFICFFGRIFRDNSGFGLVMAPELCQTID